MRKFYLAVVCLIAAGLSVAIFSCTPQACFEETTSYVKATLYNDATSLPKAADSLTVFGISRDTSLIYDKARNVQPALLPLDASTNSCTFVVRINGINDTVTFNYSSYPHLVSKECGYTFYFNIDTPVYTTNNISYIYTGRKNVTTENVENLRIFY